MPTLFSWSIKPHGSEFHAHGIVSDHQRLGEGAYIHTSRICRAEPAEDRLLLETASGNVYPLLLCELDGESAALLPAPAELGLPSDFWARCVEARRRAAEQEAEALRALGIPGALRLRTVGNTALSAFWMGQDGAVRPIPVHVHAGMFQDSVLAVDLFEDGAGFHRVDFRYFPCRHFPCLNWMEPYKVSSEIKTILIANEGLLDITFGATENAVLCPAGETAQILEPELRRQLDARGLL